MLRHSQTEIAKRGGGRQMIEQGDSRVGIAPDFGHWRFTADFPIADIGMMGLERPRLRTLWNGKFRAASDSLPFIQ